MAVPPAAIVTVPATDSDPPVSRPSSVRTIPIPAGVASVPAPEAMGIITPLEARCLLYLVGLTNGDVIEIGCERGGTTKMLAEAFPERMIHALDWTANDRLPVKHRGHIPDKVAEKASHLKNVITYNIDSTLFDYGQLWDRDIGVIFIDGDHSRDGVFQDTRLAQAYAKGRRIAMIWHDYRPDTGPGYGCIQVKSFLDDLSRVCNQDIVHFEGTELAALGVNMTIDPPEPVPALPARPVPPGKPDGTLVFASLINFFSGYGQAANAIARELETLGIPIAFDKFQPDHSFLKIDDWTLSRLLPERWRGPRLCMFPPSAPVAYKSKDTLYTMWEASLVRRDWADQVNKAGCLVVPCEWNHIGFRHSGVHLPIRKVPLGIDPLVFKPRDGWHPARETVTFGCAARMAHGGTRKGIAEVIAAFLDAFPTERNVRLRVKLWPDCEVADPDDARVTFDRRVLTTEQLASWYRGLDVYVSASKGEGFGLQTLQAMGCGVPVVAPAHSGMAEYLSDACAWLVDWDETPVPNGFLIYGVKGACWCVPRHESLVARMREAHGDAWARLAKGHAAAGIAAGFTWERTARELLAVLEEFGLVAQPSGMPSGYAGRSCQ